MLPPTTGNRANPTAYWDARLVVRLVADRPVLVGVARILETGVAPLLRPAKRTRRHAFARDRLLRLLLLLAAMARHPALASGFPRFFARPLVRGALLMRGLAALAGYLALL